MRVEMEVQFQVATGDLEINGQVVLPHDASKTDASFRTMVEQTIGAWVLAQAGMVVQSD